MPYPPLPNCFRHGCGWGARSVCWGGLQHKLSSVLNFDTFLKRPIPGVMLFVSVHVYVSGPLYHAQQVCQAVAMSQVVVGTR